MRAVSLAAQFRNTLGVDCELIPEKDDVFDVVVDGHAVFSKQAVGRFPKPGEVIEKVRNGG